MEKAVRVKGASPGQVVVEMLLILPVFLTIVFTIMEIGYVSFHLILLNHATYEVARIGGMSGNAAGTVDPGICSKIMKQIILSADATCVREGTLTDPQSLQENADLVITGKNNINLVFPISRIILAKPSGGGKRELVAVVRMPIEQPLKK